MGFAQAVGCPCSKPRLLLPYRMAAPSRGKRDRAVLSVLLGAGLRRGELCALQFDHLQQREGRWVIADLVGKHGCIRTIPVPGWCEATLDVWMVAGVPVSPDDLRRSFAKLAYKGRGAMEPIQLFPGKESTVATAVNGPPGSRQCV